MTQSIQVLVVGAGPAGLVTALWLAQNGIQVRIIDRAAEFHTGSRGFGIQPRTFELFKALGVLEDVQAAATEIPSMRAYKLPGGAVPVKTWDLYEKTGVWPDRPYANGACLGQDILEGIFRKHLAKYGIAVELNKGMVALEQGTDGVLAILANHQSGNAGSDKETVQTQYIVGADGARGVTRKLLNLTFQGETRDTDGMVWGDVEIPNLSNDYWHIWAKPGQFTIMARPIWPNEKYVFGIGITGQNFDPVDLAVSVKTEEFIKKETGREDLQFGAWTWLSYFKPNMRMVNKFSEGRVFLAGDSAHVHSPSGGQGMNSALQDAANIAWKLALVIKKISPSSLLDSYNVERLPVITQMLSATSALYTHMVAKPKSTQEEPQKATEEDAENDKKVGFYRWRNSALHMYGINYRYSPVVLEERDTAAASWDPEDVRAHAYAGYEGRGTLCAGDRAPEAPGLVNTDTGETLSILGTLATSWHTVLVFGKEISPELTAVLAKYPAAIVKTYRILATHQSTHNAVLGATLIDQDGHAHNAYRVENDTNVVVIIRPDTFIGAIVKDAGGVARYFEKIFLKTAL